MVHARRVAHVLAPQARLLHNITAADRAAAPAAVVLLFYKAAGCPFSVSLLPVVQCSAAFFSPDVPFIALQQVGDSGGLGVDCGDCGFATPAVRYSTVLHVMLHRLEVACLFIHRLVGHVVPISLPPSYFTVYWLFQYIASLCKGFAVDCAVRATALPEDSCREWL